MHITLGIFLKIFKLFDRGCKHLDYRLARCSVDDDMEDEELERALETVTNKEDSIERHRHNLANCTEMYYKQIMDADDENTARELTATFRNHCETVEAGLKRMVCLFQFNFANNKESVLRIYIFISNLVTKRC